MLGTPAPDLPTTNNPLPPPRDIPTLLFALILVCCFESIIVFTLTDSSYPQSELFNAVNWTLYLYARYSGGGRLLLYIVNVKYVLEYLQ